MRRSTVILFAFIILVGAEILVVFYSPTFLENIRIDSANPGIVRVASPQPYGQINSPVSITGQAPGTWFFEASFPIYIVNWDGLIVGEGYARAKKDWMTTAYVPFEASIFYKLPDKPVAGTYSEEGVIIFKKDNPSGLLKYDDSFEVPVIFE